MSNYCNHRGGITLWRCMVMIVFAIARIGLADQGEILNSRDSAALMGEVRSGCTNLVIAYGSLIGVEHEDYIQIARYTITGIERNIIDTNIIRIVYMNNTATTPLPADAILLVTKMFGLKSTYIALGYEGWRGILADTPENRARILGSSSDALSRTPKENMLEETQALDLTKRIVSARDGGGVIVDSINIRMPFGWHFLARCAAPGTEPIGPYYRRRIYINDSGDVVLYKKIIDRVRSRNK